MLTAFDVGVGVLVLISAILATARGLTREVLSLATWGAKTKMTPANSRLVQPAAIEHSPKIALSLVLFCPLISAIYFVAVIPNPAPAIVAIVKPVILIMEKAPKSSTPSKRAASTAVAKLPAATTTDCTAVHLIPRMNRRFTPPPPP